MLVVQILAFLEKKVTILRKNLKIDNILYSIKKQSKRNKELKYRRKNIVWVVSIGLWPCIFNTNLS